METDLILKIITIIHRFIDLAEIFFKLNAGKSVENENTKKN